jgi:DNA-binding transcriptional ArsR family regulator
VHSIVHILNLAVHTMKFKIESRRRTVASLLAQSMTETEIAKQLNVDQSTISRDIKVLKKLSQRFVYDLAKSNLAFYYRQCLSGIEEVKRRVWKIINNKSADLSTRDKLLALKLILDCNESKFELFKEGPAIMQIKSMEERLSNIEFRQNGRQFSEEI